MLYLLLAVMSLLINNILSFLFLTQLICVFLLELLNLNFLILLVLNRVLLNACIVKEPLCEEIDRICGLCLVKHSEALSDDKSKVVALDVFGVWMLNGTVLVRCVGCRY